MKTRKAKTKVVVSVSALACLVVFSLSGYAGKLEPSAPPGPTMKTLDEVEPRTPIGPNTTPGDAMCVYKITQSGSYYLTGNVTAEPNKNGIVVAANDVSIDLMGYSLIGAHNSRLLRFGIYMDGRNNVEIRNGTVRDFTNIGIYEASRPAGRHHRIINVRAMSNMFDGIHLKGYGHLVKDCTAANNGDNGIFVARVQGLTTYPTGSSTITGCGAHNNDANGITVGYGCVVTSNSARDNQGDGIQADTGSVVGQNAVLNNEARGIFVEGACTVTGNTAAHNSYGIYIKGSCLVDQNTAVSNGTDNIYDYYGISTITASNHAP